MGTFLPLTHEDWAVFQLPKGHCTLHVWLPKAYGLWAADEGCFTALCGARAEKAGGGRPSREDITATRACSKGTRQGWGLQKRLWYSSLSLMGHVKRCECWVPFTMGPRR